MRGQLVLSGCDTRMPLRAWCDAVYAILISAPSNLSERIKGLDSGLITAAAVNDPVGARADWGMRPEHQRVAIPTEE